MTYRFIYPNGDPAVLTEVQREVLTKISNRNGFTNTVIVSPIFGSDGGVMVETDEGMFIGVETDGYAHT